MGSEMRKGRMFISHRAASIAEEVVFGVDRWCLLWTDHADGFPASRGRVSTLPKNSGRNGSVIVVRAVRVVRVELRRDASVGRARCAGRGCGGKGRRLCAPASRKVGFEPNWASVEASEGQRGFHPK